MRKIIGFRTGGTVSMSSDEGGALKVDAKAQEGIAGIINSIPGIEYAVRGFDQQNNIAIGGDSSTYPRAELLQMAMAVLMAAQESKPVIVEHGTDTENLASATVALGGVEIIKKAVVFLAAMKTLTAPGSDAPGNARAAALFAAYGDKSGVFTVRPNGHIFTARPDTYGLSTAWHARGYENVNSYFGRVDLDRLAKFTEAYIPKRGKPSLYNNLNPMIEVANFYTDDGTLDSFDQIVVAKEGLVPLVQLTGEGGRDKGMLTYNIIQFLCKSFGRSKATVPYVRNNFAKALLAEINQRVLNNDIISNVIPLFISSENVKRYKTSHYEIHTYWDDILQENLASLIGTDKSKIVVDFWKKYSEQPNLDMDFDNILVIDAASDPRYLYKLVKNRDFEPAGVIIKGTGSAGLRMKSQDESYRPALEVLKENGIPVVLTSSSGGEVTSFKYGPGRELVENDLTYFAGTMDSNLILPRMALLNNSHNYKFMKDLTGSLEVGEEQKNSIERNIKRQLLSGNHYSKPEPGELSDRKRIEILYGIESRADLLGGMHVKKAIFAAYMHEAMRNNLTIPVPKELEQILLS